MARNKYDVDEELQEGFNISHLKRLIRYMKPYKNKVTFCNFNDNLKLCFFTWTIFNKNCIR